MPILLWILSTSLPSPLFLLISSFPVLTRHTKHIMSHTWFYKNRIFYDIHFPSLLSFKVHVGNPLRIYLETLPSYQERLNSYYWMTSQHFRIRLCHNLHNTSATMRSPTPRILALSTSMQTFLVCSLVWPCFQGKDFTGDNGKTRAFLILILSAC